MSKNCRKHFHRISEYLDGELDKRICEEIEMHIRNCRECRECIDSLRDTIRLCREGSKEENAGRSQGPPEGHPYGTAWKRQAGDNGEYRMSLITPDFMCNLFSRFGS